MAGKVITALLRIALGALFVYAGVVKIWDFKSGGSATQDFFQDIMNYQITPWDVSMAAAVYLPWLEVVTGLALIIRKWAAGAATIIVLLMSVFIAALATAWVRNLDITCGCFGRENATANFPLQLTRDLALLGMALFVLWRELRRVADEQGMFLSRTHAPKGKLVF